MNYLLDTNACMAVINGSPLSVRTKLQKVIDDGNEVFVPAIALFELWYGVAKSSRQDFNRKKLEVFLAGPVIVIPFQHEDAEAAGVIRASLEASGKPIGAYDLLIAGQALHLQLTLVTADVSEFSRVKGLAWQGWAKLG